MKRISFFLFFIPMLLLQSCIMDDESNCKSYLQLRFQYTLNKQYVDLFGPEIYRITVFIFDEDGKYIARYSEQGSKLTSSYVMRIPLPRGKYTALAYGGYFTTYSVGELDKFTGMLNESLREEMTDINDFRIELKNTADADNYLIPRYTPDDLYVGMAANASSTEDPSRVNVISLMKDTKKIKVKISGTNIIDALPDVYITAVNGRYKYDNTIDTNHGTFKYLPMQTLSTFNQVEVNLKKMRLMLEHPSMLVIKDKNKQAVLYNENMIELILSTGKYASQEDLDREDEFAFEISIINDVATIVSINGWKINNITPYD